MAVVSTVQQVGISISLGLGISGPLAVVAVVTVSVGVAVAVSVAVVSTVQEVGVSLGLSISGPLAVVGKGGDDGGVLVDDGLTLTVRRTWRRFQEAVAALPLRSDLELGPCRPPPRAPMRLPCSPLPSMLHFSHSTLGDPSGSSVRQTST